MGEAKEGVIGQLVFASPFEYIERGSGQTRRTEVNLKWRGEDDLEIYYSPEVFPRDPGHDFQHGGLKVRVVSTSIK
jgi:hypothetical protein